MSINNKKIAVIGMACRYPGANNISEYWNNLLESKDTIKRFTDEELSQFEFQFDEQKNNPSFIKARGILDNVDKFDSEFFGMTPRDAAFTDPQHRVWLETAWEAFENAGCDPVNYPGAIGVFAGGCLNSYLLNNVLRDPVRYENYIRLRRSDSFQTMTANDVSFIPTKTAYHFNLKGPAINVQTTCSTSLVAISEACQSLYNLNSDVCLAGAICILVPQESGYVYQDGAIHSSDGYCRPFDAGANGTVFSNGVGAVVLKRLDDAIRDRDRIYAVVDGWAINNDGSNKLSYTAPSIDGQSEVVMMAQTFGEISPDVISYIEAHGTGTQLGDPIEIAALKKAFSNKTNRKQYCGIGSVKGNIGHTDVAAGVASFIKACLIAYYKKIPASLNFSALNPYIDLENSPFYIQKEFKEWTQNTPLIIGVSSFGIGGTNSHVILEEPPAQNRSTKLSSEYPELIILSGKTENSLATRKKDLLEFLNNNPDTDIQDVAYTLGTGRNHMANRGYFVASDSKTISSNSISFRSGKRDNLISEIAFMFPGQGAQYIAMGKDLYKSNSVFSQILDECFEIVRSETGVDLKALLFDSTDIEDGDRKLASTAITQPVLFIVEYALAKVFEHLNIKPKYLIGHSIGEYVAACLSGVFDLKTALQIVIKRGQLMQSMKPGKMMAVMASFDQLKNLTNSCFEIAADNAPALCTISFILEKSEDVKTLLDNNNIQYIPLNTSHAFHSITCDPVLSEFREFVSRFSLNSPAIPFISCLTGTFITKDDAISADYWVKQLRNTVLFRNGISNISKNEDVIFLEMGPNTHLSSLVRQNNDVENKKAIITTLGKPDGINEQNKILSALGNMFIIGRNIDFRLLQKDVKPFKVSLPTYPFEKKRHWMDFKLPDTIDAKSGSLTEADGSTNVNGKFQTSEIKSTEAKTIEKDTGVILKIWKSMTGISEIGLDENFFELGGQSLLALQIMTRIKEELDFNISLKSFYENPTINKLSSLLEKDKVSLNDRPSFGPSANLTNFALTSSQRGIWISSQFNASNPAYNIPFTYHLKGNLNAEVFKKSINILFSRHPVVFSVFGQKDGIPFYNIISEKVSFNEIDFSSEAPESRIEKIYSIAGEDSRKVFNIEKGPLFRLYLLKEDGSNYYFHITIHHLVFDGWSWNIFINDLTKIYKSQIHNEDLDLEPIDFQYSDYTKWQEHLDNKANEEVSKQFWIDNLKDYLPKLNFPYDNPRKEIPTGFGAKEYLKISSECTSLLKALSKKENATLFPTILSSLGILLQKYSGENDICIGTAVTNRPQTKLEKIFGMFINTTVIRLKIEEENRFSDLIAFSRNAVLDAISHMDISFDKVVEVVKAKRVLNINPIFQVSLVWLNTIAKPMDLEGIKGERVTIEKGVSPFDITFYLWEKENYIEGEIEYNIDILEKDTIIRLKDNFITLINSLVEHPELNISSIPMISEEERKKILSFAGNRTNFPKDKTIIELFEDQVNLYPDKTALVFKENSLSYKQLNERANQLARTLRKHGVGENEPVALLADKSLEVIVGILGIFTAGGGYVPIDPDYPEQRINFMVKDSGCRVLLTQDKYGHIPVEGVIKLSLNSPSSYSTDKSRLKSINDPSSLAYVMYTSGTTGKPKGSMILQSGVIRLVRDTNYIRLTPSDRILLTGAMVFDATTFEIWGALLNGGCLYMCENSTILDHRALGEALKKNEITVLWLTSSLFTHIAELGTDIFSKLNYLFVGGDVVTVSSINKVRNDNPGLKVINAYGPTENTTFSTTFLVDRNYENNIPIGKPISNSTAYIFDRYMNYQPIGIIGELYVGGDGLSKGYINRDDLNKHSFIEHPYIAGERIYKTGDYASWLPDGNIEFHGRIDNQLKIRGFRVELGEIESAISEVEGIIEVVIKPLKISEGDMRLAAFLNVSDTFSIDTKELSTKLKEKLPPFMIPSAFKIMHGFPKTINGKIDRDALVLEISEIAEKNIQHLKTLTETEKKILEIWSDVLKTKDILTTDNFFEIGGNSLLSISVMSKIESVFNIELGLRVFFDSPRIKDLAEAIDIFNNGKVNVKSYKQLKDNNIQIISGEI